MPRIKVDDVQLHYQQTGSGPDVVLLHGFTSNMAIWMFSGIVPVLARDFRVTMYDLRGHGMSEVTKSGYTSERLAGDLAGIFRELGLEEALVVGHSLGGVVGMHAAVLTPELVGGVILSDCYFPGLAHLHPDMSHTAVWGDLAKAFAKAGLQLGEQVDFARLFEVVGQMTPEAQEQIHDELGPPAVRWLEHLAQLADTQAATEAFEVAGLTAEVLATVGQSVVALYDEHTPFRATCDHLQAHLPNCKVDIVPGARHLALLENSQAFMELVHKHLRAMAGIGPVEVGR